MALAAAAVLAMAAPASAGEDLVSYLTKGKLKVKREVKYRFVCSADCQVTVTSKLAIKGPDIAPLTNTGQFAAGSPVVALVEMNKPLRSSIKDHIGASKLRTEVSATNIATGETDTDRRAFRFKK